jgi:hypothetical protein
MKATTNYKGFKLVKTYRKNTCAVVCVFKQGKFVASVDTLAEAFGSIDRGEV